MPLPRFGYCETAFFVGGTFHKKNNSTKKTRLSALTFFDKAIDLENIGIRTFSRWMDGKISRGRINHH